MPNEETVPAAETPETARISTETAFSACYATHCRFNTGTACMMRENAIGKNGQCVNFEIRRPEHIRKSLEARGDLTREQVDAVMAEIEAKEKAERQKELYTNVSY